ncbi:MAG: Hydroxyacylglutathione hydrolase [Promethearchaeota archaeon]|nr:MAG: Hydroxyacylglutathione hydrolase [Candidatus Lokiarchaeota archaeon]
MDNTPILTVSKPINEFIHHIDLKEFGQSRILSSFIAEFDDFSLLLDCGSSLEVNKIFKYTRKHNIDLSSFKYLITTHHHFDHNGGMWKVYKKIKKYNPDVQIITNSLTKNLLNNYESHLNRAKRTFGEFIGEMRPIEEEAYTIIEPLQDFHQIPLNSFKALDEFYIDDKKVKLAILKTPGHTPDHQCPIFIRDDKIEFCFFGEAVGTIYHSSELVTMPTSMPVYFNYQDYIKTLEQLKHLNPSLAGFCHFGAVKGEKNIQGLLQEHENFMEEFRTKIIDLYEEKPHTKYIVEEITPYFEKRTDLKNSHPILKNIILGVVYGMMMDLGYRKD